MRTVFKFKLVLNTGIYPWPRRVQVCTRGVGQYTSELTSGHRWHRGQEVVSIVVGTGTRVSDTDFQRSFLCHRHPRSAPRSHFQEYRLVD